MTIQNVITQLATLEATITGIAAAHDETPESINQFPTFLNFPAEGSFDRHMAHGIRRHTYTIKAQLFFGKADQKSAESKARPFLYLFMEMLDTHIFLNNSCITSKLAHWAYGKLEMNKTIYLGYDFDIEVVEDEAKTFVG